MEEGLGHKESSTLRQKMAEALQGTTIADLTREIAENRREHSWLKVTAWAEARSTAMTTVKLIDLKGLSSEERERRKRASVI